MISRDALLEHAWDLAYEARSNVVDVYIRRLREKVDRPGGSLAAESNARVIERGESFAQL